MSLYMQAKWEYYKYIIEPWSQPANPAGITSSGSWVNANLAFDKNSGTYATCTDLDSFIEWDLGVEVLISGMSAAGNQIGYVSRQENVSIYLVNDNGTETLLGVGVSNRDGGNYITSCNFAAVWAKKIRFRLSTYKNAPTSQYPTRINEINIIATQQRRVERGTEGNNDYVIFKGKKNKGIRF